MEQDKLDLQKLAYFTEGNSFTGSKTKDRETGPLLRYLVRPEREEPGLRVFCWTEDLCFEKAEEKREKLFSLDEEGLGQALAWLTAQYEAL